MRQHVAQSRLEFYFLQQILVLLFVLPLKLQLASQQIQIQRLWLAFAKPSNTANKNTWWTVKTAWIQSRPVTPCTKLKSSVCPVQRPRGLSQSLGHLIYPFKTRSKKVLSQKIKLFGWLSETKLHTKRTSLARTKSRRKWRPEVKVHVRRNAKLHERRIIIVGCAGLSLYFLFFQTNKMEWK